MVNTRKNGVQGRFPLDACILFNSIEEEHGESCTVDVERLAESFIAQSIAEIFFGNITKSQEVIEISKNIERDLSKARSSLRFLIHNLMPKLVASNIFSPEVQSFLCENKGKLESFHSFRSFHFGIKSSENHFDFESNCRFMTIIASG